MNRFDMALGKKPKKKDSDFSLLPWIGKEISKKEMVRRLSKKVEVPILTMGRVNANGDIFSTQMMQDIAAMHGIDVDSEMQDFHRRGMLCNGCADFTVNTIKDTNVVYPYCTHVPKEASPIRLFDNCLPGEEIISPRWCPKKRHLFEGANSVCHYEEGEQK